MTDQASDVEVTGEPRDTETIKRGSERGRWKSVSQGITRWRPTLPPVPFLGEGAMVTPPPYPTVRCAPAFGSS
jgi:hypothetical protein